jgi:hypothetical protein
MGQVVHCQNMRNLASTLSGMIVFDEYYNEDSQARETNQGTVYHNHINLFFTY